MTASFNLRLNVVTAIFAFVANVGLVFVSYKLVIAQGGLEVLGIWSTLLAWIYMIRLGDVGMATATTRFVAAADLEVDGPAIRRYIDTGIVMNSLLFAVLSVVGGTVMGYQIENILPPSAQNEGRAILPIMIGGFFLMNVAGLVTGALQGLHLGYRGAWLGIVGTLVQLSVAVALVPRQGLEGLAWAQLSQYALMSIVGWALVLRAVGDKARLPRYITVATFREMLGFSVRAQIANVVNGMFEPVAKIIVGRFAGLEVLGRFELAYKIVALPRNAVVAGVHASIPAITRLITYNIEDARNLYKKTVRRVCTAGAAVLAVVVLLAPVISWLWLENVDKQLWIFIVLLAIGFLVNTMGAPAFTLGMASGLMIGNIQSAVLSVTSMLLAAVVGELIGGSVGIVSGVMLGLAIGGVYIRWRNERLIAVVRA